MEGDRVEETWTHADPGSRGQQLQLEGEHGQPPRRDGAPCLWGAAWAEATQSRSSTEPFCALALGTGATLPRGPCLGPQGLSPTFGIPLPTFL